jgi:hypothetical protein
MGMGEVAVMGNLLFSPDQRDAGRSGDKKSVAHGRRILARPRRPGLSLRVLSRRASTVLTSRSRFDLDQGTTGSAAGRWLVLVLTMGAAGWAAYTLYERTVVVAAPVPEVTVPTDGVAKFIEEAQGHLLKGDLEDARAEFLKASGVDDGDERVLEGLALVAVMRAEASWWQAELGGNRKVAVGRLDREVDDARQAIATAARASTGEALRTRLKLYERRLNTFVVVSFVRTGDRERAEGALHARLEDHPQKKLLEAYVAATDENAAGEGGASGDKSGSLADEEVIPPHPRTSGGTNQEEHFEFDSEPHSASPHSAKPTTAGELQLPGTAN